MPKEMLIAVGAGVVSSIAAAAFLNQVPGGMFFGYLASLPLFMAGLAIGPKAVAIGGAVGFMATGLLAGGLAAGVFAMVQVLPAWLVVKQMLLQRSGGAAGAVDWFPAGEVLCWLTLLAAAMLALAALAGSGDEGIMTVVTTNLDHFLESVAPAMDEGRQATMVATMAPLFPGAVGVSWVVMTIVNGTLAQGLLVRTGHNLRPSPAYANLALPQWMSWPLIGSAVLALVGSGELEYTGRNLAMILALPYFFLGLAVVHSWTRRLAFTGVALAVFYTVLVIWGWAMLAVAGIGVLEQWGGLRQWFGGSGGGQPPANDE
ncbi:MAG: DUF2232 domain-containing protein [Rhodospirillales bacterium]